MMLGPTYICITITVGYEKEFKLLKLKIRMFDVVMKYTSSKSRVK